MNLDAELENMGDSDEGNAFKKLVTNEVSKVKTCQSMPGNFRESEQKSHSTYSKKETTNASESDSSNSILHKNDLSKRLKKMDFAIENHVGNVDAAEKVMDIDQNNESGTMNNLKRNSPPTIACGIKLELGGDRSNNDRIPKLKFAGVKETCSTATHKAEGDQNCCVTISTVNDSFTDSLAKSSSPYSGNCVSNDVITLESSSDEESLPHTIVHPSKKLKFNDNDKSSKHCSLDNNFKEASAKSRSTLNRRNQPKLSEESFTITRSTEQLCKQDESSDIFDKLPKLPCIAVESDNSDSDNHKKETFKYNVPSGHSGNKVQRNTYLELMTRKSESGNCQSKTSAQKPRIAGKPSTFDSPSQSKERVKKMIISESKKGDNGPVRDKDGALKRKVRDKAISAETKSEERVDRKELIHPDTRNPLEIKDVAAVVVKILSKYHQHRRIADKVR